MVQGLTLNHKTLTSTSILVNLVIDRFSILTITTLHSTLLNLLLTQHLLTNSQLTIKEGTHHFDKSFISQKFHRVNFKVKTMFKTIDFRALTAITLFLLALLFSLPNLVIAMLLMLLISALLELIRMLGLWQPARTSQPSTSSAMLQA